MTGIEMRKEADAYLTTLLEERKLAGIPKVPEFDERDVLQAYSGGLLSGLRHHSYDYLVKTADLKKRYEKQKEINKELVEENEELKKQITAKVYEVRWSAFYRTGKFYMHATDEADALQQFLKQKNLSYTDIIEIREVEKCGQ